MEGRKFIFHVFDVKCAYLADYIVMEFVLSTKGNDNVLFEQTLLFMMTKYRSKRTHKSSASQKRSSVNIEVQDFYSNNTTNVEYIIINLSCI